MENQNNLNSNLFYSEKVDLCFQTYKKCLFECLSSLSEPLKVCTSFESLQTQELINLIYILNNQINAVDKFLADYSKIKETV